LVVVMVWKQRVTFHDSTYNLWFLKRDVSQMISVRVRDNVYLV
jgi:hypothetical protein